MYKTLTTAASAVKTIFTTLDMLTDTDNTNDVEAVTQFTTGIPCALEPPANLVLLSPLPTLDIDQPSTSHQQTVACQLLLYGAHQVFTPSSSMCIGLLVQSQL